MSDAKLDKIIELLTSIDDKLKTINENVSSIDLEPSVPTNEIINPINLDE